MLCWDWRNQLKEVVTRIKEAVPRKMGGDCKEGKRERERGLSWKTQRKRERKRERGERERLFVLVMTEIIWRQIGIGRVLIHRKQDKWFNVLSLSIYLGFFFHNKYNLFMFHKVTFNFYHGFYVISPTLYSFIWFMLFNEYFRRWQD